MCMHILRMYMVPAYVHISFCTQMHIAAANGYGDVIKYLVKKGADLNVQDDRGCTPLHVAAKFGQVSFFCSEDQDICVAAEGLLVLERNYPVALA